MLRNIRGIIGCMFMIILLGMANAETITCVDSFNNSELTNFIQSINGTKVLDYSGYNECSLVVRYGNFNSEEILFSNDIFLKVYRAFESILFTNLGLF